MVTYTFKYDDGLYDVEFWRGNERYSLCLDYDEYQEFVFEGCIWGLLAIICLKEYSYGNYLY